MTTDRQVGRTGDGALVVDDPTLPWLLTVWTRDRGGAVQISALRVDLRQGSPRLSARMLARVPIAHLRQLAAAQLAHPNELLYRMLAVPKPAGQRSWDSGHWERVLTVYAWACASGRPGGGRQAVADLWGVSVNPTVNRWLAEARRRSTVSDSTYS